MPISKNPNISYKPCIKPSLVNSYNCRIQITLPNGQKGTLNNHVKIDHELIESPFIEKMKYVYNKLQELKDKERKFKFKINDLVPRKWTFS